MAEDAVKKAQSPDETLRNETQSERQGSATTSTDVLTDSQVADKALDKFNVLNKPTDRATAENLAKLGGQIHSAEEQIAAAPIYQGTAHPEHQTYGAIGVPMAALTHDYDQDRIVMAQQTVRTKPEDPEVKKHNDEVLKVTSVLNKSAKKESELSGAEQAQKA